jgi:hypothetical protein
MCCQTLCPSNDALAPLAQGIPSTPIRRAERSPGAVLRSSSSSGLLRQSSSRPLDSTAVVLPIRFGSSDFT